MTVSLLWPTAHGLVDAALIRRSFYCGWLNEVLGGEPSRKTRVTVESKDGTSRTVEMFGGEDEFLVGLMSVTGSQGHASGLWRHGVKRIVLEPMEAE